MVVTGGASGLGLLIARIYALRGASVAVLDLRGISDDEVEEMGLGGCYVCDVSDRGALEEVVGRVAEEVCIFLSFFSLLLSTLYMYIWWEGGRLVILIWLMTDG